VDNTLYNSKLTIFDGQAISTHTWCDTCLILYFVRKSKGASARPLYLQHRLGSSCILLCGFSVSDAGAKWFIIEFIGLVVFTLITVLGLRVSLWFLTL
jgi:hypothetical protein